MALPKILAFDFGLARVGVAASFGTLAEPLVILPNDDQLWQRVKDLIAQHHIDTLLVGISEQTMAELSTEFGQSLSTQFGLPVVYADETLSSVEIHRRLHDRDKDRRQYKGPIDHFAAALILQNYLDEQYA